MIRRNEILFLFGAGVSADAGIPTSREMVNKLEQLLAQDDDFRSFADIYHFVKNKLYPQNYAQDEITTFSVEILLVLLDELTIETANSVNTFNMWSSDKIKDFKRKIVTKLKEWLKIDDLQKTTYLRELKRFKNEFNFPLKIFTLNYDLLIEETLGNELQIESGFDRDGRWNRTRFFEFGQEPDIYLYKLHGSINWELDRGNLIVYKRDYIPDEPVLLFGTQCEPLYGDPYLFLFSEFLRHCLEARLIVCIGYSFSDKHINTILKQALFSNSEAKIIVLLYEENPQKVYRTVSRERTNLIIGKSAQEFFAEDLILDKFKEIMSRDEDFFTS